MERYRAYLQVLTIASYVSAIGAAVMFLLWRSMTKRTWVRWVFTIIPTVILGLVVIRISAQAGLLDWKDAPMVAVVAATIYVLNDWLMMFMFGLATRIVRRRNRELREYVERTPGGTIIDERERVPDIKASELSRALFEELLSLKKSSGTG